MNSSSLSFSRGVSSISCFQGCRSCRPLGSPTQVAHSGRPNPRQRRSRAPVIVGRMIDPERMEQVAHALDRIGQRARDDQAVAQHGDARVAAAPSSRPCSVRGRRRRRTSRPTPTTPPRHDARSIPPAMRAARPRPRAVRARATAIAAVARQASGPDGARPARSASPDACRPSATMSHPMVRSRHARSRWSSTSRRPRRRRRCSPAATTRGMHHARRSARRPDARVRPRSDTTSSHRES